MAHKQGTKAQPTRELKERKIWKCNSPTCSEISFSMMPKHANTSGQACKRPQNSKLGMAITLQA